MLKDAFENLTAAVTTINTPMPASIDEATLLASLKGEISERKWRVYMQALFDEVDVSVIHNLVVDRIVTRGEAFIDRARDIALEALAEIRDSLPVK